VVLCAMASVVGGMWVVVYDTRVLSTLTPSTRWCAGCGHGGYMCRVGFVWVAALLSAC
jgi:hypothetical protein